jgi:protein HIRA/HIR1
VEVAVSYALSGHIYFKFMCCIKAYNPHIFLRNPSAPVATVNICSVVALGADDRSVSVWQTKSARPLIVAREVFERQIMDLSW